VAAATLQINGAVAQVSLARHDGAGAEPELMVALLDLGFGFVLAMAPLSLLVAAVAVVAGFVLAVGGVALGFLPLALSWLWFVAAGLSAVRRVGEVAAPRALAKS